MNILRSVSLLAFAAAALSAQAVVAYSNKPSGGPSLLGYAVVPTQNVGYQFVSGATGLLTGFDMAINNNLGAGFTPLSFTLDLYTDNGGILGTRLGSYAGQSAGLVGYASVAAGGTTLTQGATYWLVASSSNDLHWGWVDNVATQRTLYTEPETVYGELTSGAFSVNVADAPAVPGPLAALPFVLIALNRRRKRA